MARWLRSGWRSPWWAVAVGSLYIGLGIGSIFGLPLFLSGAAWLVIGAFFLLSGLVSRASERKLREP